MTAHVIGKTHTDHPPSSPSQGPLLSLVETLATASCLDVQQQAKLSKLFFDWQTSEQFTLFDPQRRPIGALLEETGVNAMFRRQWRSWPRSFTIVDGLRQPQLRLQRPFFWFFPDVEISVASGQPLGAVRSRFAWFKTILDLEDARGQVFARVIKPWFRLWTYPVFLAHGGPGGEITKLWGGAMRELFTDAVTLRVTFPAQHVPPAQRAVMLAAALLIDLQFFEGESHIPAAGAAKLVEEQAGGAIIELLMSFFK